MRMMGAEGPLAGRFRVVSRLAIAAILAATAAPVSGQETELLVLEPGDQIRLIGPMPRDDLRVAGTIVSVTPYSFEFTLEDRPDRVYTRSFDTLASIDVAYRDARRSAVTGGLWGLFLGSAVGLVAGPFIATDVSLGTGPTMALTAAAGGLIGGIAGAITGATMAPLRWNRYVFDPTRVSTE